MTTAKRLKSGIIALAATLIIGGLLSAALSLVTVRTVQTFSTLPLSDFTYEPTGRLSLKYPLGAMVHYYPDGDYQKAIIEGKGYGYRKNEALPYLDRITINVSVMDERMFNAAQYKEVHFDGDRAITEQPSSEGDDSPLTTKVYLRDAGRIYIITIDTSNQKSLAKRYTQEIIQSIRLEQ